MIRSLVVVAILSVVVLSITPAMLVSSGEMIRDTQFNVVQDIDGPVSLAKEGTVKANGRYRTLVTVTNSFQQPITVTVSLRDPTEGTLSAGGQQGNQVTFDLASGNSQTVDIDVNNNIADGEVIYYDIQATASGLDVTMNQRSTTATNSGGGNGNGNGQGPGNGQGN